MMLWDFRQNDVRQNDIRQKDVAPKMWATSVNFQKLPKENNRPLGEFSPNLVTQIMKNGSQTLILLGGKRK
jgi:hypothetical protein